MQEIRSSNPPVVTEICNLNKSREYYIFTYSFGDEHKIMSEKINLISLSWTLDKCVHTKLRNSVQNNYGQIYLYVFNNF